jgi:hypothetical protein
LQIDIVTVLGCGLGNTPQCGAIIGVSDKNRNLDHWPVIILYSNKLECFSFIVFYYLNERQLIRVEPQEGL